MKEVLGIHVYEKRGPILWEDELLAVNLLSILSWKRFHGRIHLYTNEEYLETLQKWGIDKLYDKIDTTTLKQIPDRLNQKEYWAFGKIHVAGEIAEPFVLIDTDLWLNAPLEFDKKSAFMAYHFENFDESFNLNPYIDFDNLIPEKWIGRWNKEIMPVNTALLWFNHDILKNEWIEISKEIALQTEQISLEDVYGSKKMVLIEQRVLPMLAFERKLFDDFGFVGGREAAFHFKHGDLKAQEEFLMFALRAIHEMLHERGEALHLFLHLPQLAPHFPHVAA
jgi:hypothetical protein